MCLQKTERWVSEGEDLSGHFFSCQCNDEFITADSTKSVAEKICLYRQTDPRLSGGGRPGVASSGDPCTSVLAAFCGSVSWRQPVGRENRFRKEQSIFPGEKSYFFLSLRHCSGRVSVSAAGPDRGGGPFCVHILGGGCFAVCHITLPAQGGEVAEKKTIVFFSENYISGEVGSGRWSSGFRQSSDGSFQW